ncbi:hypothetical protein [Pectinatus frisingensis]|uniref:hypothetical protein n=1 Tax=Pectinatus frisingensis TaxID=865 RepID=UPI0018C74DE5|nr:hypothetical protein [Pectinatus frisingensis]
MKNNFVQEKEYGGYLEFEYFHGKEYHKDAYGFNTARQAFRYVLRERHIQKIYLPEYLCPVILEACNQEGVTVKFYPVDKSFRPLVDKVSKDEWLYFINFYGQFDNNQIRIFHQQYPHMIIDNTQAFFQKPLQDVDTIYTCRKFGVTDGAYLYTQIPKNIYEQLPYDQSAKRVEYLIGRLENNASTYYEEFKHIQRTYSGLCILRMSKFTRNMMKGINYDFVKRKRTNNFRHLNNILGEINEIPLKYIERIYVSLIYKKCFTN